MPEGPETKRMSDSISKSLVGKDIIRKNKASPESLIDSINFFNKINV